ncbi:hypothetical protein ABBQ38_014723 [Trebouxia sp. C0009 RCD-2024]
MPATSYNAGKVAGLRQYTQSAICGLPCLMKARMATPWPSVQISWKRRFQGSMMAASFQILQQVAQFYAQRVRLKRGMVSIAYFANTCTYCCSRPALPMASLDQA